MFEGGGFIGDNDVQPAGEGSSQYKGNSSGGHALGRWTHTFNEESDLYLQAYYDHTHLNAPFQGAGTIPPGSLVDSLDTVDLQFQHRFPIGEHNNVVWGMEYRFTHDVNRPAPLVASSPSAWTRICSALFSRTKSSSSTGLISPSAAKWSTTTTPARNDEPNARLRWTFARTKCSGRPYRGPSERRPVLTATFTSQTRDMVSFWSATTPFLGDGNCLRTGLSRFAQFPGLRVHLALLQRLR